MLVTFGQINGNIGLMATGFVIIFCESALTGFTTALAGLAVGVGVLMVIFAIIFMYGGRKK